MGGALRRGVLDAAVAGAARAIASGVGQRDRGGDRAVGQPREVDRVAPLPRPLTTTSWPTLPSENVTVAVASVDAGDRVARCGLLGGADKAVAVVERDRGRWRAVRGGVLGAAVAGAASGVAGGVGQRDRGRDRAVGEARAQIDRGRAIA